MSIAKEEGRKLVRAYYVEFLNKFLSRAINKDSFKINFDDETLLKEIEKFKEKALTENVWVRFQIIENELFVNFIHSITHVSIKWKVYLHKILKGEIEDLDFSTEENVKALLNDEVISIQNFLADNFYNWKPYIYKKKKLIEEGDTNTIYWLDSSISQLVWSTFTGWRSEVRDYNLNTSLIKNWFNYQEDYNKQDTFTFSKEKNGNWRMNIKDYPDYYVLIKKDKKEAV